MPRWNRREKPDYRHLRDVTDEAALLNAIRYPTYGELDDYRLLAGVQARLVAMWGHWDVLALESLVDAHEAVRARDPGFFGHGRNWQGPVLHDIVGNLVGWGLRLEILQEVEETRIRVGEEPSKGRAFRMVRRDPLFERMGDGRYRRLDADGVRAKSARGAGQREAYRIRYAERIAPQVAELVGVLCDQGTAVPDSWFTRFPEQLARLKGLVERIADARTTFEEAHRGMHLADQKRWVDALGYQADRIMGPHLPRKPVQASVPDEDLDALGSLT